MPYIQLWTFIFRTLYKNGLKSTVLNSSRFTKFIELQIGLQFCVQKWSKVTKVETWPIILKLSRTDFGQKSSLCSIWVESGFSYDFLWPPMHLVKWCTNTWRTVLISLEPLQYYLPTLSANLVEVIWDKTLKLITKPIQFHC